MKTRSVTEPQRPITVEIYKIQKKNNRAYLIVVLNCLRYVARQGIAMQGGHGEDNFTIF